MKKGIPVDMAYYAIGVDLGGTNLRIAAVDEFGKLLAKTALGTEVSQGREHVIDELCRATLAMTQEMREKHHEEAELCGIGVGVPGLVDSESGRLLESPNLPGWSNYDVKSDIERRLGTAVILENDANAAALGEQWLGAGRDFDSMCMYTLGTGVGGGLVVNGGIWRGWNGMAGELGHCNVEPEGHACKCGSHGCLEQYASATAVVRMARQALASGAVTQLRGFAGTELTARLVYEIATRGDSVAKQIFECVGRALGLAIANMVNTVNLPLYVIGGGVSSAWDAFSPALFDEVRKRSFVYAWTTAEDGKGVGGRQRSTRITRALLGGDGGLYGAARLPMVYPAVTSKS
jgi:glucokinase